MLNRILIMGRLTANPVLRHTQTETAVASFTLAVERDFKDKQTGEKKVDFIDVVAWRNTAEFVSKYFTKGRMAVVEGKLQSRKWTDDSGNNRVNWEVVAENVYFGDSKSAEQQSSNQQSAGSGTPPSQGTYSPSSQGDRFAELTDDDGELPF